MRNSNHLHKNKKKYYNYTFIPNCESNILLILTVILFTSNQNKTNTHDKYQDKSSKKKNSIIKSNTTYNKTYDTPSETLPHIPLLILTQLLNNNKNNIEIEKDKKSEKHNDILTNDYDKDHYDEINFLIMLLSIINQLDKSMESNSLQQNDNMNDKNYNNEIYKNSEEIPHQDCLAENDIPPLNKSTPLTRDTTEKSKKTHSPLSETIKNDYRGVMISAILPNGITISGEVAYNFNGIVALKYDNTIVFINENHIVSFF